MVRDNLAPALQAGLDPDEVARSKFFRGYLGSMTAAPPADVLAAGDSGPRPDDYRSECEMVLDFIQQVWNDRDLEKVTQFMPRDLFLNDIGYRTWIRPEGYRRSLLKLLRPFPSGQFQIRDIQTNYSIDYAGLRIAVCWVFVGDYDGQADFGPLTGKPHRPPRRLPVPGPERQDHARDAHLRRDRAARADQPAARRRTGPLHQHLLIHPRSDKENHHD